MPVYLIIFFAIHFVLALVVITLLLSSKKLDPVGVERNVKIAFIIPIAGPLIGFVFYKEFNTGSQSDKGGFGDGGIPIDSDGGHDGD